MENIEIVENDVYTHKLSKPVEYNGNTYDELNFDFDKTTGDDCLNIFKELNALGIMVPVPALNDEYLIRFAARACLEDMVGSEIFRILPSRDYLRILSRAKSFLLGAD